MCFHVKKKQIATGLDVLFSIRSEGPYFNNLETSAATGSRCCCAIVCSIVLLLHTCTDAAARTALALTEFGPDGEKVELVVVGVVLESFLRDGDSFETDAKM